MRSKTGRRPPQGTVGVIDPKQEEAMDRKADRLLVAIGLESALKDDEFSDLLDALDDRNDKESARLLKILKERYKEQWAIVGKLLVEARRGKIRNRKVKSEK